jgi:phenylalanyl-tRNA synthetase beta chain
MNVSYQWLRALVPELVASPEEVAETLALRGAPVEELLHLAPGLEGLVVARVESVEAHPNADRLSVCQVDGGNGTTQVVCGAPVVQVGGYYPYVAPGSKLPGGMLIKSVSLRGVDSYGMLCSEAELEMGPDADGIMLLEGEFDPGTPLTTALGLDDWRLDVEVTPNRGDLLSHVGVARELAPAGAESLTLSPIPGSAGDPWVRKDRAVDASETPLPLETGKTEANAGGVSVRVLLEMGQPLHAFDLDKLGGSSIVVRRAREGEVIRTLDGEDRRLAEGMLAICDASAPVAIAGVMGGADSEVSQETTDILLECALFNPASVRATRNGLDMSTDASYRFERGVDPKGMELAVRRAVEIILATSGGIPDPSVLDACPEPWKGLEVTLRVSRVEKLLGIDLSEAEVRDLLAPLGFEVVAQSAGRMTFSVPGFRSYDVRREVDLLEEVARTYGYDRFPSDLGPFRPGNVPDHPLFQLEDDLRDLLVGEGFFEAQTMAFSPEDEGVVEVSNPVSKEEAWLRTGLLPGLLRRVEYNLARGTRDVRLFELGTVFLEAGADPEGAPKEEPRLGLTVTGDQAPLHWSGEPQEVDLWYLKGLLARLVVGARLEGSAIVAGAPGMLGVVPEEAFAVVGADGERVGFAGRMEPGRVDAPAWAGPVWALELQLPCEPGPRPVPVYEAPPAFPGVDRDLALLLPKAIRVRQVDDLIREAAGPLLVGLGIFDLYEGRGVPDDHRSVAFRLQYQSDHRTLTDKDVDRSVTTVTKRLREELGVETRS